MGRRRRRHSAGPGIAIGHCGLREAALRLIIPIHNEAGQLVANVAGLRTELGRDTSSPPDLRNRVRGRR